MMSVADKRLKVGGPQVCLHQSEEKTKYILHSISNVHRSVSYKHHPDRTLGARFMNNRIIIVNFVWFPLQIKIEVRREIDLFTVVYTTFQEKVPWDIQHWKLYFKKRF